MDFIKYQHIERLGTPETDGILMGTCYIFPKIDGTNSSIWAGDGLNLHCGSRNRDLTDGEDNHGFREWVKQNEQLLLPFFIEYPLARLYGEWLVPHTLKTYRTDAWRKFYVFDVWNITPKSDETFFRLLPYTEYQPILEKFGIDYIPPLAVTENPTVESITGMLERNVYLIEDGKGSGEGVVIKNYDYWNQYSRQTWAKIVKNEFKEQHWSNEPTKVRAPDQTEEKIARKYITEALVEKEYAKIASESGWSSKMIPRLLSTVFYCLIKEEAWSFVKDHKNPVIDFKNLNQWVIRRIKEIKPELF
jgi:hypothetical protein